MAGKPRARRARSDDPKKLGRNGGNGGSHDDDDGDEDAIPAEPKEMPLKQAEERSPPSPEDAGAQGSGEASPARSKRSATTTSKRVKKPPPASPEGDEAEEDSRDASPARGAPLPDSAHAGHDNKNAATPKRGEKRSPPPLHEEKRPEKRVAGPDADTVAASAPKRKKKKKSKRPAEKDGRKKKKQQLRKALTKPTSPQPPLLELELNDNREDTPSSTEIFQKDTSTSPPKDNRSVDEEELLKDTSPPQEKNKDHEAEETTVQAVNDKVFQVNNAPSSETEKRPAVERSWSYADELKILTALVEHAQSHDGALPDSLHLLTNLTFDKIDANEEKLADKIRKLKARYHRMLSQGFPSDHRTRRLFRLSEKLWGQVDEDEQAVPASRDFIALSKLYPHLAKEVKAYAKTHSSRDLIMSMFMTIGDEKARDLDAKCKKLQIEAFKLELGQASLINELLSAASSSARVRF